MPLPGCLKCICPFFLISSCLGIVLLSGCGSGSAAHQEPSPPVFPPATVPLVKLSSDPFTNASSQHATEVEPDTFAFGPTIVSAFQVGRIHDGGGKWRWVLSLHQMGAKRGRHRLSWRVR